MHVHFLGIAGTFMASLALLAKELGFKVTGQDQNIYPPMSDQLESAKIDFIEGYEIKDLPDSADLIIIGNVMKRGMPIIEYILNRDLPFSSGPGFLSEFILSQKHVLVVSGTHGKTTTTSMLTWILHAAGLNPGYLIGGVPKNFSVSASIGKSKFFVIEGDEYDCAFFDKRSKFIHYRPKTLIINNIEFDHADLFKDLSAIITQFHHLVRLVPGNGNIIFNQSDLNIKKLLDLGSWSNLQEFNINLKNKDNIIHKDLILALKESLPKSIPGQHNLSNAMAACLAAISIGIDLDLAVKSLSSFKGVSRRLEYKGCYREVRIYDDFAHHPTAIAATIKALFDLLAINDISIPKGKLGKKSNSVVAVIDLGSNTLKMGINNNELIKAVQKVSKVYLYADLKKVDWDVKDLFILMKKPGKVIFDLEDLIDTLDQELQPGDNLLFMSNGSLATATNKLIDRIKV